MPRSDPPLFYEPLDDPLTLAVTDRVIQPVLQRCWGRIRRLVIAPADLERLRAMRSQPVLICPNHPSLLEPVMVWGVLTRAGLRANYVMARATMEQLGRLRIHAQRMGIYSVRRGVADRPSFARTRELLKAGRAVVMFPEGETYGLNDLLLTFHEGVVQLGFWAAQDLDKAAASRQVALLPMALKHTYLRDMRPAIDRSLSRLERALGLAQPGRAERYERLRQVGFAFARTLLAEYGEAVAEETSLTDLIELARQRVVQLAAARLEVTLDPAASLQDQLRRLYGAVHDELLPQSAALSPYRRRLQQQRALLIEMLSRDLARVQIFQAVEDGYVASHPSAERYLDVLNRLELEILGRMRYWGPRQTEVRVGEPLDLGDRLDAYRGARQQTVGAVTRELRQRVLELLQPMSAATPTLSAPVANPATPSAAGSSSGPDPRLDQPGGGA